MSTHKRPFQDITHKFIDPPLARPKPRRKPKVPVGALGEKVRLRVVEPTAKAATPANVFPSSLPPSSPPVYSSSSNDVPLLNSEDEVAQEIEEPRYNPSEFASDDEDAENRPPTPTLSDPFGFFAVERKLKAARAAAPPPVPRPSRATDDKQRDDGRIMPSTPHKPRLGKRDADPSPATTSLASSPSPVKDRTRDSLVEEDDSPPKRKKARPSPVMTLPVRRSARTRSKAASKEKDKAVEPKPKKRARKAPTKRVPKVKKEEEDVEEDYDNDKYETERQARLEYFKKLDDYSFEKEDVFVV
ncbi:hypothetical protein FB45DRAFT_998726 [Roridomyces roridus]|uniref:Uncharacterized protein n=1 Tax=Roridomyces roridus TaxID=1738132 RepID=A0AAD7CGA9_9AGAR|nr:hypothetical protein FB45DRAFT_998726 [Roridomyces roridus]